MYLLLEHYFVNLWVSGPIITPFGSTRSPAVVDFAATGPPGPLDRRTDNLSM